jgi:hypothetical protein
MNGRAASRAVALRGPLLKERPPQGDGDGLMLAANVFNNILGAPIDSVM